MKNILSILAGLIASIFVVPAFADDFYGDNYNNDYYVKAPVPVASPSPYAASANSAGFVFGLDLGYANTHWDNIDAPGFDISNTGFAARGYIGYTFNQYLGIESGYAYLPKADVSGSDATIENYAVDLLGKLSVPITSGFDIFAKAGLGYLNSNASGSLFDAGDHSHVGPAFGVGAGYEVMPNLALNLSWIRYSGDGKIDDNSYQPNPDVLFFGLSYTIPSRTS